MLIIINFSNCNKQNLVKMEKIEDEVPAGLKSTDRLKLPVFSELKDGEEAKTGNPKRRKPKLKRSGAINFEEDEEAAKLI